MFTIRPGNNLRIVTTDIFGCKRSRVLLGIYKIGFSSDEFYFIDHGVKFIFKPCTSDSKYWSFDREELIDPIFRYLNQKVNFIIMYNYAILYPADPEFSPLRIDPVRNVDHNCIENDNTIKICSETMEFTIEDFVITDITLFSKEV